MGVLGNDGVLIIQLERDLEALAQLREVVEGTSQERHVTADGAAACEAGDGLRDHGLEDGSGYVFSPCTFVEERLDVRLGEDAAA